MFLRCFKDWTLLAMGSLEISSPVVAIEVKAAATRRLASTSRALESRPMSARAFQGNRSLQLCDRSFTMLSSNDPTFSLAFAVYLHEILHETQTAGPLRQDVNRNRNRSLCEGDRPL